MYARTIVVAGLLCHASFCFADTGAVNASPSPWAVTSRADATNDLQDRLSKALKAGPAVQANPKVGLYGVYASYAYRLAEAPSHYAQVCIAGSPVACGAAYDIPTASYVLPPDVAFCDLEHGSFSFRGCLHAYVADEVKAAPNQPAAVMVYELTINNRATGAASTVDVLAASAHPQLGNIGSAAFTLVASPASDAGRAEVAVTINGVNVSGQLGSGESVTAALSPTESLSVVRL